MSLRAHSLAVLVILFTLSSLAAQAPARKSVLIVLPDPPGRPLSGAVLEGIQAELRRQRLDIAISADYIAQVAKDRPDFGAAQLSWYRTKYAAVKFDAIITVGPQALQALLRLRQDLWSEVPLIWCAVDPDSSLGHPPLATGTFLDLRPGIAQRTALQMLPNTKHLALVGGSSPTDRFFNASALASTKKSRPDLDLIDLTNLSLGDLKTRLAKLPPQTVVIINSYFYDPAGKPMFMRDLVEAIAPVSTAPIFDGGEFALGAGTLGGHMHHYSMIGEEAAQIAVRVLEGEKPEHIQPFRTHAAAFHFDWRQLRKWKIPLDLLPPGSQIHFREETLWERYRWWIAGALLFAVLESALIAILLIARRLGKRSEALNSAILGSLPGHIFIIDRDAVIIRCSSGESLPLGRAAAGTNYRDAWKQVEDVAASDVARIHAALRSVLADKTNHPVLEFPFHDGAGDHWTEIRMEALDRPEGGAVIAHLDISASKLAEIEARRSKEQLLHLNRIASMGELAASLAHELNQPLAGILTNAQAAIRFLAQTPPDSAEVCAALTDIHDDGTRAGEVIRKMRNMLKTGHTQTLPLNLNAVAEEAVALLHPDAHLRKISIALELDPGLPDVAGDAIQLQQVIMNLVLNAMEAVQEATRTGVNSGRKAEIEVWSGLAPEGQHVQMSVKDSGPGIGMESLSHVFQPFFSTKPDGLGMGLSISRSIVEAHGGTIVAESEPGRGSTFRISFPVLGSSYKRTPHE
jgi:signal transduction histidine kinase